MWVFRYSVFRWDDDVVLEILAALIYKLFSRIPWLTINWCLGKHLRKTFQFENFILCRSILIFQWFVDATAMAGRRKGKGVPRRRLRLLFLNVDGVGLVVHVWQFHRLLHALHLIHIRQLHLNCIMAPL